MAPFQIPTKQLTGQIFLDVLPIFFPLDVLVSTILKRFQCVPGHKTGIFTIPYFQVLVSPPVSAIRMLTHKHTQQLPSFATNLKGLKGA